MSNAICRFDGVLNKTQACNSVSNAYDSIDELFANLEGFANRLSEYTKGKIGEQLQKNVTAILTW